MQGLSKYLGRDIRIVFEVAEASPRNPGAAARRSRSRTGRRAPRPRSRQDPAVKGLRERFGAEVDVASVKPVN